MFNKVVAANKRDEDHFNLFLKVTFLKLSLVSGSLGFKCNKDNRCTECSDHILKKYMFFLFQICRFLKLFLISFESGLKGALI